MFSIVFICPYFGQLPKNQFPLWLKSCKNNPTINWLIFTDDKTHYDYPKNVKVNYIEFEDFKKQIQKKFSFPLQIERPYKLCDFRPAYGYIFPEYIRNYDFWGYCDISDTILGQLRNFFTDENLSQADKILQSGHMTLYRNTKEVNSRFMLKANKSLPLESILGVKESKIFDEFSEFGINYIYKDNHYPIKVIDNMYMDIVPFSLNFRICCVNEDFSFYLPDKKGRCFIWEQGKLYAYEMIAEKLHKQEIGYVHFQSRRMINKVPDSADSFFIIPNKFIPASSEMSKRLFKKFTKKHITNSPKIKFIIKYLIKQLRFKRK